MQYTELHLHTHYSLLDGLNTPEEYLKRGKELGMTHMAITDHGVLSGHREFQKYAKEAGIIPILGCEMYISPTDRFDKRSVKKRDDNTQAYNHLGVLAKNEVGLRNLNQLSEIAWTEGFYSKPRIDMDVLAEHSDGLIVLSGCLNGLIAKAIANEMPKHASALAAQFKEIFGDRFFIEIQGHNPKEINDGLLRVAKEYNIKPVVTSDCHHSRKEDTWLEDALLIISTKPKPDRTADFSKSQKMGMLDRLNYLYPERQMSFQDFGLFLHNAEDHMNGKWADGTDMSIVEQAIDNTNLVASMVEEYPYHENLDLLPRPTNGDPDELLEKAAMRGMVEKGLFNKKEYTDRLYEELTIIKDKDFSTYFLILIDMLKWCREQGIRIGPGRGSGAGSLVNYVTGITGVDPIEYNLLFFRFINPDRNDFPDIDIDIEDSRRSEVKAYLTKKFGNVASIATFGRFQGKNSVRDAARVFLVPLGDVNKALKSADYPPKADFFKLWLESERGRTFDKKYPEVTNLARLLYGRIRSQGMHAGGVVLSKEPITNYAPMQTAKDNSDDAGERIPLVAYDMDTVGEIGLIKYDLLGLKALTIISDTLALVKSRWDQDIDEYEIPLNDSVVFKSLSDGYTQGVFQAEGHTFTHWLLKNGAAEFNDLVIGTSIARPGPLNTVGEDYRKRKFKMEPVTYIHPIMQEFTNETLGVIIYQEQVMQAMVYLAGMKMTTADKVRKIIGKKRDVAEFEQYKDEFIKGASQNVHELVATKLWHDFEAHAGYSFNKSHAVPYSLITYWTAWLKHHYPLEFMTAVLSNEKNKDKRLDYLMEAKRLNIRFKLPDVNESNLDFEIQSDEKGEFIRFGLSDIKFISGKVGNNLMSRRPFKSYAHLQQAVFEKGSGLSTRTLQALNAIGAATFNDNPKRGDERDNLFEYLAIPAFNSAALAGHIVEQFRDLDEFSETEAFVCMGMVRDIKTGDGWARLELVDESGSASAFINPDNAVEAGKMYVFLIANNSVIRYILTDDIVSGNIGHFGEFLQAESFPDVPEPMLKVIAFTSRKTKKGQNMATVVFSDENKNLFTALVWPSGFMKAYSKCKEGAVVDVMFGQTDDGTNFIQNIL